MGHPTDHSEQPRPSSSKPGAPHDGPTWPQSPVSAGGPGKPPRALTHHDRNQLQNKQNFKDTCPFFPWRRGWGGPAKAFGES